MRQSANRPNSSAIVTHIYSLFGYLLIGYLGFLKGIDVAYKFADCEDKQLKKKRCSEYNVS